MRLEKEKIISILKNINQLGTLSLTDKDKIDYLVTMHDLGLIRYDLLNSINYNYWWYEVDEDSATYAKIDRNKFTPALNNFSLTFKGLTFLKVAKINNKWRWNYIFSETEQQIDSFEYKVQNWKEFVALQQPKQLNLFYLS